MSHGRTEEWSDARRTAILEALRLGNTRRASAQAAGVSPDTLYRWMAADTAFSDAVTRAESEAEFYLVQCIRNAAPTDWRAGESLLKRRFRAEWGDTLDLRKLDDATILRLLDAEAGETGEAETPVGGSSAAGTADPE